MYNTTGVPERFLTSLVDVTTSSRYSETDTSLADVSVGFASGEVAVTTDVLGPHVDDVLWQATTRTLLARYIVPTIASVGLTGNLVCLGVLRSPRLRLSPASLLLSLQSSVDSLLLLLVLVPYMLGGRTYLYFPRLGDRACGAWNYVKLLFHHLMTWTTVLVAIERAVVVSKPIKAKLYCNKRRMGFAWCVVAVYLALMNIPAYFVMRELDDDAQHSDVTFSAYGHCEADQAWFQYDITYVILFVYFISGVVIPIPTILVSSIIIVAVTSASRKKMDRLSSEFNGPMRKVLQKREAALTAMMLPICITYLVTIIPFTVVDVFTAYDGFPMTTREERLTASLVKELGDALSYMNSTANVFLYYLSGSTFRRALAGLVGRLFACVWGGGHRSPGRPGEETSPWFTTRSPNDK